MSNLGEYKNILQEIKHTIKHSQQIAYMKVNNQMIEMYFRIGEIISKQQEKNGRGAGTIRQISKDLLDEFGPKSGYSVRNLMYMNKFYSIYNSSNMQQLVAQLPRGQNITILDKCKSMEEREFYINLTISKGLSRNVLVHQIEGKAYEISQKEPLSNFDMTIPEESDLVNQIVKDEYILDLMGLQEPFAEKELEKTLVENIKKFMLELGTDFCFMGNQYKLNLEGTDYFVDLLFFHRGLKRMFAIELKVGDFKVEFVSKMNLYLGLLDDTIKKPDEEKSIGIILCKTKKKLTVEYALRDSSKPIAIATYKIIKELEEKMKGLL